MPSIFRRLFRRKSSKSPGDLIGTNSKKKLTKKQKKKNQKLNQSGSFAPSVDASHKISSPPSRVFQASHVTSPDEVVRIASFNTSTAPSSENSGGHVSHSYSGSSTENHIKITKINHNNSGGSSGRNDDSSRSGRTSRSHSRDDDDSDTNSTGPENDENHFVADFSRFTGDPNTNMTNQTTGRLGYDQVQKLEQHMETVPIEPLYPHHSNKRQLTRLPDGQLLPMSSLKGGLLSPSSASSEFDLSTDDDNEYNQIRRNANNNLTPMLEPSHDSTDEDEESIGLNTIRRNDSIRKNVSYLSNSESETEGPDATEHDDGGNYFADSDPKQVDTEICSHSGSTSPSEAENDETGTFVFEQKFDETLAASQIKKKQAMDRDLILSPSSGGTSSSAGSAEKSLSTTLSPRTIAIQQALSLNTTLSPRTIAIQQAQNMRKQGKFATEFYPESTDSELGDMKTQQQKDLLPSRTKSSEDSSSLDNGNQRQGNSDGVIENFVDFGHNNFSNLSRVGSKSVADPTSPVSELLRQAKDRRNRRKEASSVSSAPITNLTNLGYGQSKRDKGRKFKNGQSPARTRADDASASASSAAKEKLRRRRYEKEAYLKSIKHDSDEGSEKGGDGNESWLIDGVTGALGPVGIAADLESLGERSGISKASYRSSHGKNGKRRSRRNKQRSDESTGSRHSRHSRGSRYSIKSTKSQASILSEQSRSVTNDLLRLEMQLARVGSKNTGDNKIEGSSMGDNGIKLNSARKTAFRSKNSIARRVKLTVVAPAGKLGIILANKTDAKGTVVSGVRTTSALADRISPGDRIIEIDGEDVSRMAVSEITNIMARQNDFERVLTVLTTARDTEMNSTAHAPSQGSDAGHDGRW